MFSIFSLLISISKFVEIFLTDRINIDNPLAWFEIKTAPSDYPTSEIIFPLLLNWSNLSVVVIVVIFHYIFCIDVKQVCYNIATLC